MPPVSASASSRARSGAPQTAAVNISRKVKA
jgi:hypothetical protein